jgi:type VI secretion system FHA domain protein
MNLTLEVTGPQASAMGAARRKVFGVEGGTIGRLPDNDWVLADPYVSGRHAIIRFIDGAFYIEDVGRNGVFINSPDERITRGRPHPLNSGDRILIDPYEIEARVTADERPAAGSRSSFDSFAPANPFPAPPFPVPGDSLVPSDPLDALGLQSDAPSAPRGPSSPELAGGSPLWSHYSPPAVEPSAEQPRELIPSNWLDSSISIPAAVDNRRSVAAAPSAPAPSAPSRARVEPPAHPAPQPPDNAMVAFMEAAGLRDAALAPDVARNLGAIFRIVVSGVMDVLKARQQTKDQFNLGMTTFKRTDNNPLKFSADVDDALHNLFVKAHNPAYLGPVDAFEDAFADMRNHQIAMLVGLRAAFEAMLSEFQPDHLQEQFDRQVKKGALVSMPARLRYWELYREWIHDMVRDADTSFRELFGEEFARAYEEQLRRLKARGREG